MADDPDGANPERSRRRGGARRGDDRGTQRGGRGRGGPQRGRRGRRHVVGRGDVRAAVLALLAEEPMHGYQIMREVADRSGGLWQPSPGSIYPLLQQLTDEGLVTMSEEDDRRVFRLTESGRAAAAEAPAIPVWERMAADDTVDLRQAVSSVAAAAMQINHTGSDDQLAAAAEILADARKRLYLVLAEG